MAVPVLIVDDSSMSRKLLIRALPKEWDVEITEACNGAEALEKYRQGKAHVIFLDLTMPIKDGYDVLEELKKEGMKSLVIVISADIQEKAQQRVLSLGALAFIKKPVNAAEISKILKNFGIIS